MPGHHLKSELPPDAALEPNCQRGHRPFSAFLQAASIDVPRGKPARRFAGRSRTGPYYLSDFVSASYSLTCQASRRALFFSTFARGLGMASASPVARAAMQYSRQWLALHEAHVNERIIAPFCPESKMGCRRHRLQVPVCTDAMYSTAQSNDGNESPSCRSSCARLVTPCPGAFSPRHRIDLLTDWNRQN